MIEKIKLIIGVVSLIFIFLPLGSCEQKKVESPDSFSTKMVIENPASKQHIINDQEPDYLVDITCAFLRCVRCVGDDCGDANHYC